MAGQYGAFFPVLPAPVFSLTGACSAWQKGGRILHR
jgi:hypothetical protein